MRHISRADNSVLGRWWWSVDQVSLAVLALIIVVGVVVLMAAGPSAAARLRIANEFHFPLRQFLFLAPALVAVVGISFLTPLQARRFGVILFCISLVLMLIVLLSSADVNGAKRWIDLGFAGLQPSEFAKPGFVIVAAWMLAEGARDPGFPGGAIAMGLYAVFAALLLLQPDYGQWALVTAVWAVMFFIAGWSWFWIAVLGVSGAVLMIAGYFFSPHVAARIDSFLKPGTGETYQVDHALAAFANGGALGRGDAPPVKGALPDAHADFIFAVAAEEFGFILCVLIIAL
ncbi:MAG: FtsW/RodA/SpoVE family cell cycle protein, partial [Hyphococcus sp.]